MKMKIETKNEIRSFIESGKAKDAIEEISKQIEHLEFKELHSELLKWKHFDERMKEDDNALEKKKEQLTQLRQGLLAILEKIPEEVEKMVPEPLIDKHLDVDQPAMKPPIKGVREERFRIDVFVLMVMAKIIIFGYIYIQWDAGGLSTAHAKATFAIFLPIFMTYFVIMINFFWENRFLKVRPKDETPENIKNSLRYLTYLFFPVYTFLIIWIISKKITGDYEPGYIMEEMKFRLGLVESFLGVYIGRMIFHLFRRN